MSKTNKMLNELSEWFIKTFPQHCEEISLTDLEISTSMGFLLIGDTSGITLAGPREDAYNLNPPDEVKLLGRTNKGIYRSKFLISDLEYLWKNTLNQDRYRVFQEFIQNILKVKLKHISVTSGSFTPPWAYANRHHLFYLLESDPNSAELRYYFKC